MSHTVLQDFFLQRYGAETPFFFIPTQRDTNKDKFYVLQNYKCIEEKKTPINLHEAQNTILDIKIKL